MRKLMNWIKTFQIQLAFIVLMLICVELISTIIFFTVKGHTLWGKPLDNVAFSNAHLSKHYIKNSVLKLKNYPNFGADLFIDEHGLIETKNLIKAKRPILIIMGGSTVEGRGSSSNSMTIASSLSRCLNKNSKPFYVLNGGRSGLYSYTEFRHLLESFLPGFKPDIVISLNGRNDFHYSIENDVGDFNYHSDVANSKNLIYNDMFGIRMKDYLSSIYNKTHTARMLKSIIKRKAPTIYEDFIILNSRDMAARAREAARHFITQITNTKNIVETYDAKYFHFLQPTLMLDERTITAEETFYVKDWEERSSLGKKYQEELSSFYQAAKKSLPQNSYDLSDLFRSLNNQKLYTDSVHYNDTANEIIAEAVCFKLLEELS